MRIVQVNKFHYVKGGAERYYLDLSTALRGRGHRVDHLAMAHPDNLPGGPGDLFVSEVDYRSRASTTSRIRQGLRAIYNREAARGARSLARRDGPAIAHLHNIYHQLSPSVVRAFAAEQVPMVQTLHDYKLVCPAYLLMTEGAICERCRGGHYFEAVRHRCLLESRAASAVAAVEAYFHGWVRTYDAIARFLCPSRFLLEKVASFGVARDRLVHLPYFVPAAEYRVTDPPREKLAIYVGRLSREKGIATLLEAMARLPQGRLRLHVLGDGPLRPMLEARARQLASGQVVFLGYRSGDALHDEIRRGDFTIVPSEWFENLPFAILESFALGRPVAGARIGGIPELVIDGETGRLFESGDADSLAEALLWMTGPEADVVAMGRRARRRIEAEHDPSAHLDRLTALYAELLGQSSRAHRPAVSVTARSESRT